MFRKQVFLWKIFGTLFVSAYFIFTVSLVNKHYLILERQLNHSSEMEHLQKKLNGLESIPKLGKAAFPIFSSWLNFSGDESTLVNYPKCQRDYWVLILVTSKSFKSDERRAIRDTWGEDTNFEQPLWKTFFIITRSALDSEEEKLLIEYEMQKFGDIIYRDVTKENNTFTIDVLTGFDWSIKHCKFRYLLKTQDNIFVNIHKLFKLLSDKSTPRTNLYAGNVKFAANVLRSGKYEVSEKVYAKKVYPRYCSAIGYILSVDVIIKINSFVDIVPLFGIEDAYVGELALNAGIDAYHLLNYIHELSIKCVYNSDVVINRDVATPSCMERLYRSQLKHEPSNS